MQHLTIRQLPIALAAAATVLCASLANAGEIINLEALENGAEHNGYLVRYKPGTAPAEGTAQANTRLTQVIDRLIQRRALDASFSKNIKQPFGFRLASRTEHGTHAFKPSRALTRSEALATIKELAADPDVEFVEPNLILQPNFTPNDPGLPQQWGLGPAGINAGPAWDVSGGSGVIVGVLDNGITAHPDLDANIVPGWDMITNLAVANDGNARDSNPADPGDGCPSDPRRLYNSWHGTHVAGTVAAVTNNGNGVSGVAFGAKVMPVRVLGKCGGELIDIIDGITWASGGTVANATTLPATQRAKVLNMSLGGLGTCSKEMQDALNGAFARGTHVVVAAGNDGKDASAYLPASCAGVITIGAVDNTGTLASFSNYGARVDLTAPGVGILSTLNTGTTSVGTPAYATSNGTSMASPHAAGVVALVTARRAGLALPPLTTGQMRALMRHAVRPMGTACAQGCGTGMLDAPTAMRLAAMPAIPMSEQTDPANKATITVFETTAPAAAARFTDFAVPVPDDYVVIGGGVRGAGGPAAQLMTASYPNAARSAWLVSTKEHQQAGATAITAWAIGLKVNGLSRQQLLDNLSFRTASGSFSNMPMSTALTPAGYTQIGGGFRVVTSGPGNLAWANFPITQNGAPAWTAAAKEHAASSVGTMQTYSIGLRTNIPGVGVVSAVNVVSAVSPAAAQPSATAKLPSGYVLTGCGAQANWGGTAGSLLWRLQPGVDAGVGQCDAQSTDLIYGTTTTINAYATGMRIN